MKLNTKKEIRRLLQSASPVRLAIAFAVVLCMVPVALVIRYYVAEPFLLKDLSLYPDIKSSSWAVFCKLDICKEQVTPGDFILFRLRDGTLVVRKVLASGGQKVKFLSGGFVFVDGTLQFQIENEGVIIADREFYVPKQGDTLLLDSLSDIEFDYALNCLKLKNVDFFTDVKLYLGHDSLPLSLAGASRIGSRPVSVRELPGLPWQELYLIEHQIKRHLRSTQTVSFKRNAFYVNDVCSKTVDSLADSLDILKDSLTHSEIDSACSKTLRLDTLIIYENTFYTLAPSAVRAADSREFGYIPKSSVIGRMLFKFSFSNSIGDYFKRIFKKIFG